MENAEIVHLQKIAVFATSGTLIVFFSPHPLLFARERTLCILEAMDKDLTIGYDPCAAGAAGSTSVFKLITIDQVVSSSLKHRPIIDYQAEAARIANFYGAGLLVETTDIRLCEPDAIKRRLQELRPTEDAEVVSIETVPWRP